MYCSGYHPIHIPRIIFSAGGEPDRVRRGGGASAFLFLVILDGEADKDGRPDAPALRKPVATLVSVVLPCKVSQVTTLRSP